MYELSDLLLGLLIVGLLTTGVVCAGKFLFSSWRRP